MIYLWGKKTVSVTAACALCAIGCLAAGHAQLRPVVEVEETIYTYTNAQNGSSPLWAYGCNAMVRRGDDLFFNATRLIPDAQPLNNVRWELMQRTGDGWQTVQSDEADRTRENSPIGITRDGRIFMSVNPTLVPDERSGVAEPRVLIFPADDPAGEYETSIPRWDPTPEFREHSYRGFCVDPESGECLILQQEAHIAQHWAFRDRDGEWLTGSLVFPDPPEYQREELRYLYPSLALRDREAWVFARSGATECIDEWYEYKKQFGGKNVSRRRLGFAWTPDITTQPLTDWIELVNVMATGGEVWSCDLYIDPDGDAHILWYEISVQPALRSQFFPDTPIVRYLKHGVVREGKLVSVDTVVVGGEGYGEGRPHWGRFHVTADGRLLVIYDWWVSPASEDAGDHLMMLEILPDGSTSEPVETPMLWAFSTRFATANTRGGTLPSDTIDMVYAPWATRSPVRYLRVRLSADAPVVRIEGQTTLLPGEGRTLNLRAVVDDPQDDLAGITWRLPGGATTEGPELIWTCDDLDSFEVQAVATDEAGNSSVATVIASLPPAAIADAQGPVIVQAEDFDDQGEGTTAPVNIRGNVARCLRGWRTAGHWLAWSFDAPIEADYAVYARYAAADPAPRRSMLVDGISPGAAFEDIACPATGMAGENWTDWAWAPLGPVVRLTAGEHTIRLTAIEGNPEFDMLALVPVAP